ncbi:MAG: signal peptidase II [Thermoclostridium sp.]|nr:signal peptidase II [Thermoclostridium sp.]
MKRVSRLAVSILSIVLLIALDQITKKIAQASLMGKGTIPVIDDFFMLIYATNRGGFLSFGSGAAGWLWWMFFVVLPLAVLIAFSVYIVKNKKDDWFYLSFWVFVISGGVGNLIDRIFYGEVIDFMHMNFGIFQTGVFNVADLYLNVFALLVVLIYLIRFKKEDTAAEEEQQPEKG